MECKLARTLEIVVHQNCEARVEALRGRVRGTCRQRRPERRSAHDVEARHGSGCPSQIGVGTRRAFHCDLPASYTMMVHYHRVVSMDGGSADVGQRSGSCKGS